MRASVRALERAAACVDNANRAIIRLYPQACVRQINKMGFNNNTRWVSGYCIFFLSRACLSAYLPSKRRRHRRVCCNLRHFALARCPVNMRVIEISVAVRVCVNAKNAF